MCMIFKTIKWSPHLSKYYIIFNANTVEFVSGQKVPWRTPWYNYTKDFVCISEQNLLVFRDGEYKETIEYCADDIDNYYDIITDSSKIINSNGERLNIYSKTTLRDYMYHVEKWNNLKKDIRNRFGRDSTIIVSRFLDAISDSNYDYMETVRCIIPEERMSYLGAYLHLVASGNNNPKLLSEAKQYIAEKCVDMTLRDYFRWNETPVVEMSGLARAFKKICKEEYNGTG